MDLEKAKEIEKQLHRWDKFAKLAPTVFLLASIILLITNTANFDFIFLIGIIGFGITSVVWWCWTLVSIMYLISTFYKAADEIDKTGNELLKIREELSAAINHNKHT